MHTVFFCFYSNFEIFLQEKPLIFKRAKILMGVMKFSKEILILTFYKKSALIFDSSSNHLNEKNLEYNYRI